MKCKLSFTKKRFNVKDNLYVVNFVYIRFVKKERICSYIKVIVWIL